MGQDNVSPITAATRHVLYVANAPAGVPADAVESQLEKMEENIRLFCPVATVEGPSSSRAGLTSLGTGMQQTRPEQIHLTVLNHADYDLGQWKWQNYDAIVHLANVSPAEVLKNRHDARILFASSGAAKVRGRDKNYGYNKHLWEGDCRHSGADVVIARLYAFSGERLRGSYALTDFIRDAKARGPIVIRGNGRAVRTYLYGQELGVMMWGLLFNGEKGKTYDIGGQTPYTIHQVAELVAKVVPA